MSGYGTPQPPQGDPYQGQQQYYGWQQPAAPVPGGGYAIAALVCALVGLVLCWTVVGGLVLGLLGLIFGIVALRRASRHGSPGRIMGLFGLLLGILAMIASVVIVVVGVSLFKDSDIRRSFSSYSDCLDHATTQADRQQCADDFNRELNN